MTTEADIIERRVGTTLRGKWKLERLLGVGGMAAVYVGAHKIGRREAIKILHPEIAANKEIVARFEQEAHAVNRFRHPGAVEIHDIDVTEDGAPFLVMEMLEGESVESRIARQLLGINETLRIADEMLDVLAAAHAEGIVHRDIKPDNLFLLKDGRLKVLDFGIARMRQNAQNAVHTRVGVTMGTLSYMPPEQVAGKEIDARADIFAVGCTLFRLLTGRSPHDADTELALMVKMAMEPAPPLSAVAPALPGGLCMVVDRALAFDRDRRYPDAGTMQRDVQALREERPPPYASERLAAGDLPNILRAPTSMAAPVSGLGAGAALASTAIAPAPVGSLPTSMPIPMSMLMPAMTGPVSGPPSVGERPSAQGPPSMHGSPSMHGPPSMHGLPSMHGPPSFAAISAVSAPPRLTPAMPPVSSRTIVDRPPAEDRKEKAILLAGILATLVVFGVVVMIWWRHHAAPDEATQALAPGIPSSAKVAEDSPANNGNGVSSSTTSGSIFGGAPGSSPNAASPKGPAGNVGGSPPPRPGPPPPREADEDSDDEPPQAGLAPPRPPEPHGPPEPPPPPHKGKGKGHRHH